MTWQRIKCAVFGHRWTVDPDAWASDVAAERNCVCGAHIPAVRWPRTQVADAHPGFTPIRVKYSEWMSPALEHTGERILWSDGSAHRMPEDDGEFVTVLRSRGRDE